jgi:hypothetical protein
VTPSLFQKPVDNNALKHKVCGVETKRQKINNIFYRQRCSLWHVVKHGLDLGLDWTCKPWTGLVKHGLVKHGLVKHGLVKRGLVKRGLVKRGLVKHGLVKHGLDLRANLLSMICFSICTPIYTEKQVKIHELFCCARFSGVARI